MTKPDDTDRMNAFYEAGKWDKAEKECRKALEKEPDSHWWLIHLAVVLIEKEDFAGARRSLTKADKIQPYCPLVQWYDGVLTYELKKWSEALAIFQALHNRCARKLNSDGPIDFCWESVKRTEELDNDCRGCIGFCYLHLGNKKKAAWWLKQHLLNRKRNRFSIYEARVVKNYLKDLEHEQP